MWKNEWFAEKLIFQLFFFFNMKCLSSNAVLIVGLGCTIYCDIFFFFFSQFNSFLSGNRTKQKNTLCAHGWCTVILSIRHLNSARFLLLCLSV